MLLCLDLSNLVARHYHARRFDAISDAAGRPVGGAIGALRQAARLIAGLSPSHLLVARDGHRANDVRREIYPAYKAHRGEPDEHLAHNLDLASQAVELLRWPTLEADGWEADDVIASACHAYRAQVLIVSGDRDMLALCSDHVRVRLLRAGGVHITCGPADCSRLLGVHPHQVRDLKAMAGDPSDGIPGVPGVGAKSARAALAACGTLAEVYRRLDSDQTINGLRAHFASKLQAGRDLARLSWRLAGLNGDLPIDVAALDAAPALAFSAVQRPLRALGLHDRFLDTTRALA